MWRKEVVNSFLKFVEATSCKFFFIFSKIKNAIASRTCYFPPPPQAYPYFEILRLRNRNCILNNKKNKMEDIFYTDRHNGSYGKFITPNLSKLSKSRLNIGRKEIVLNCISSSIPVTCINFRGARCDDNNGRAREYRRRGGIAVFVSHRNGSRLRALNQCNPRHPSRGFYDDYPATKCDYWTESAYGAGWPVVVYIYVSVTSVTRSAHAEQRVYGSVDAEH